MKKLSFEYKISLAYIVLGGLWIVFSDKLLEVFVSDVSRLTEIQTFKGWFYVLFTAVLLFAFLKKHLTRLRFAEGELEKHRYKLEQLVVDKTNGLNMAVNELSDANEELNQKNRLINEQNAILTKTLQELKAAQVQLLQAEKMTSLGILTAGMAHEINNPLNYILGGLTGLKRHFNDLDVLDDGISLFLNSIHTGIDRISAIVGGLGKLSQNNQAYLDDCDIHEIIANCLVVIKNQLNDRISLRHNFYQQALVIKGNVGQLHQAVLNVLMNASQAIAVEGTIIIATNEHKGMACIEVTDTGCGIADVDLPRVMDPFFTTKDPGKGTGLGLSIAYNIVQAYNGSIHISSEVNVGTTVLMKLPLKRDRAA